MAGKFSTLDPMTQARAGEHSLDSQLVDTIEGLNTLRAAEAMYQLATSPHPQAEVDVSREGNLPMVYDFMTQSSLLPASRYFHDTSPQQYSQNLPVIEHDGFRYDRVQGFPGQEMSLGRSLDGATRHEHPQNMGDSSLGNDQPRVLLTFPAGEADAVTITERDMEGLQPFEYLSDNIIDFYIKYLERRLDTADRNRFYFFNSFFFTKLVGNTSASNDIDEFKVDYEQVRKWSGEVNLFEKDYIFIPVLRSSHWSLIIICHLSSLSSAPDKKRGSPCILHLDAVEGQHENFKRQVRSYISKVWMEKYQASNNMDQLLDLCQMKYVRAKVPRQKNGYDCGVYLLHYVEVFVLQPTSLRFNFVPSKGVPLFTSQHFAEDVSVKRMAIHKLILELSRTSHEQVANSMDTGNFSQELGTCWDVEAVPGERIEDVQSNGISMFDAQGDESKRAVQSSTGVIAVDNNHQRYITETEHTDHRTTWESVLDTKPLNRVEIAHDAYQSIGEVTMDKKQQSEKPPCAASLKPWKETKKRKWTEGETSLLLKCRVEGGRFCKENQTGTRWDIISQEIKNSLGTEPSPDQCRLRYDTLLKAYKTIKNYCMKNGKTFSEITEAERLDLKLATTLTEGWYEAIDEICHRCPPKAKSQRRVKLSDDHGLPSLIPCNPAPLSPPAPGLAPAPAPVPPPISAPVPVPTGTLKPEKPFPKQVAVPGFSTLDEDLRFTLVNLIQTSFMKVWGNPELEVVCHWLAVVQDQAPLMIRRFIFQLLERKLVNFKYQENWCDKGTLHLEISNLQVYKKFLEKVLRKNPDFDMYVRVCDDYDSVSFPKVPSVSLSLHRIRVLSLDECKYLKRADLSNFPELRALAISWCKNLKSITGWEVVKELGWLEIRYCRSYDDFPPVQCLPSLREFLFTQYGSLTRQVIPVSDLSQCVRLRRLEIWDSDSSALNSMDLSNLRFLEVLSFDDCPALTTIQGLSGLHALTRLDLGGCFALRRVPELGCLKALTHLDMRRSGVEAIPEVLELHSLTSLDLAYCSSLKTLPWLGHLKALAYLDISCSGVEEIPGVQELHLLTELKLYFCRSLKTLPWLGHLKALAELDICWSGVEEIPGVEDLVSLEILRCGGSRLKGLPDLHHLPRLREVLVWNTPLSNYGKQVLVYTSHGKAVTMGFIDEISDISDTE